MGAQTGPPEVDPSQPSLFRIEADTVDGFRVARLTGEIDLSNAADLQRVLSGLVEQGPVVVDLAGLEFLDSTGLSALVVVRRQADRVGHRLVLAGARGAVRKVLEITELNRHLGSHPDVPAAVAALGRSGAGS